METAAPGDLACARFWDQEDLAAEAGRVFRICRSCRRCASYCPSFSLLVGEEAPAAAIAAACFQCQRCLVGCPYAAPQPEAVDLPHLLLRARLQERRRRGLPAGERWLAHPDLVLALGSLTRPWSNWLLRRSFFRSLLETATGLDRAQPLPAFEGPPLEPWFRKRERGFRRRIRGGNGRVSLFCGCRLNYAGGGLGKKIIEVLHHNDIQVDLPGVRCCGRPALEAGDEERLRENMQENLRVLGSGTRQGAPLLLADPGCAWMLVREYPRLSGSPAATRLAGSSWETCSFLLSLHRAGRLRTDFAPLPETLGYHRSCHLAALGSGSAGQELLELIPAVKIRPVDACCGMGMLWGMTRTWREESLRLGRPAASRLLEGQPDRIVSESGHAALRLAELTGVRVWHPIEILHQAYGLGTGGRPQARPAS